MFLNVPIFTKKGEIKFQNASTLKKIHILLKSDFIGAAIIFSL